MTSLSPAKACLEAIEKWQAPLEKPLKIMEVCGTHTMAIARHALKQLLPPGIVLVSGPGCPVCVTHQKDLEHALEMARNPEILLTTYGDMLRVPAYRSSLLEERARGASVTVVTSAMEALELASKEPKKKVIFLGVGFETTAPATAAAILRARERKISNFFVLSLHKRVPPVLRYLASRENLQIRGFLLPGHVATILGEPPFGFLGEEFHLASAIAGFEREDILLGMAALLRQMARGEFRLRNVYSRSVRPEGNPEARKLMEEVFESAPALWRGLGTLEDSGLVLRKNYHNFDAARIFPAPSSMPEEDPLEKLCRCGDILMGRLAPRECPLFGTTCTPLHPLGPCMVSGEGSCAAAWKYEKNASRAAADFSLAREAE